MLKAWLKTGLLVTTFAMFASGSAWSHGGNYKGPSDTVPPNLGGGGDTTPPGNPGGPGTPGPGAPTTGGAGKGPTTGGGPTGPTTGGAGGAGMRPTTGGLGGKRGSSEGFERWEFWWEHNKDPFLDLKTRLGKGAVSSGAGGFLVGRTKLSEAVSANRPSPSDVKNILVPAFIEALSESHPDIVDSAALAIGRSIRAEDAADAITALTKTLGHTEKTGREAATLALGVLGSVDSVETLREILNDTQKGRSLTNHPQGVEDLVRSFSAAALGLIGDAKAVDDLKKAITDPNLSSKLGLKAMSILSLGMMKEGHANIVSFLLGLMEDRSLNNIVRAQAPIALGRLNRQIEGGSPEARQVLGPKIVPLFEDDKTDNDLRRSLAICIGMLATVEDAKAIESLLNYIAKGNDEQTRHFSIMALAEIGARDAEPAKHQEVHNKLREFFERELTQPKRLTHQPYGALGLAVYSRNEHLGADVKTQAAAKLHEAFNSTSNPSYQGAMAIGLGLLDYKIAAEDLWKKFDDSNDQPLKGYIAVSLGLMRASKYNDSLREHILKKGLDQKFRLQLARSLGLMSDAQAVPTLIDYLQTAETIAESSSAAQALGLIGDRSAVEPLLSILKNKSKQPLQRGFAAVALGIIAEKTTLPWNAVFSVDSNYRAKVDALSEILDIL
jgi:HEAT repeat protein